MSQTLTAPSAASPTPASATTFPALARVAWEGAVSPGVETTHAVQVRVGEPTTPLEQLFPPLAWITWRTATC